MKQPVRFATGTAALATLLCAMTACTSMPRPAEDEGPKYVFFFVGDGMSGAQIQAAEAFRAGDEDSAETLLAERNRLHMTRMPFAGLNSTFSDTRFITDSAAAVTALACGIKTRPGALGRDTGLATSYRSIAELAQEQGRAIGIVSSVPLSHATPAGYYANVNSRNNHCEIGYQAAQSGFDFFGGGRFPDMDSDNNAAKIPLHRALGDAGYTTLTNRNDILKLKDQSQGKVICSVATSHGDNAMPFAIDHPDENFSLAEITQAAIQYLQSDPGGFFIMVEGGKIDWAGHANDVATAVHEVLAFDEAVGVAIDFMNNYPEDTLVVVTSDHDTGGLALGFRGTKYQTQLANLKRQTKSGGRFVAEDLNPYKASHPWTAAEESNIDDEMKSIIANVFGLEWDALSEYQHELLEKAYDASLGGVGRDTRPSGYDLDGDVQVDHLSYGGREPLVVILTRIVANESGLDWSSYGHTAVPAPVYAAGMEAERFSGHYDNTDIAKKLAEIMGLPAMPVEDADRSGPSPF
jgi:alkaline phosphatase